MTETVKTDPFKQIKEILSKSKEKTKKALDSMTARVNSTLARKLNHIAELKSCVSESQEMLKDENYPNHRKFLIGLRTSYSKHLEYLSANMNDTNKYEISGIAKSLEVFDLLINRPGQLLKELKAFEKEDNDAR